MNYKKMKNGVRFVSKHTPGYGVLPAWSTHFFYKNRTLAKNKSSSCCSNAVWTDRKRRKLGKLTEEQLLELIEGAPQAFQVCDQCVRPLVTGGVYQGDLQRCRRFSDKTPWNEVDPSVTERAHARVRVQAEAGRLKREAQRNGDHEKD